MENLIHKEALKGFQEKMKELGISELPFDNDLWDEEVSLEMKALNGDFFEIIKKVASKRGKDEKFHSKKLANLLEFCDRWHCKIIGDFYHLNQIAYLNHLFYVTLKELETYIRDSLMEKGMDFLVEKMEKELTKGEYRSFVLKVSFSSEPEQLIFKQAKKVFLEKQQDFSDTYHMVFSEIQGAILKYYINMYKVDI